MISLKQEPEALTAAFHREFEEGGVDVVLDYLWGESAQALLSALPGHGSPRQGARLRFVQIGSISGETIPLKASVLRSSGLELIGSGLGSVSTPRLLEGIGELFHREDGQTQQSLSDRLLVDKSATVTAINRLEALGYVERRGNRNDRRQHVVYLTDKGRRIRAELESIVAEVQEASAETRWSTLNPRLTAGVSLSTSPWSSAQEWKLYSGLLEQSSRATVTSQGRPRAER